MTATQAPERPRLQIDPRIRARRIEVRRDEGRRRLRRLGFLATAVLLLAVGYGVVHSPLLGVRKLRVSGGEHTPASLILRASGLRRGAAMVDVSTVTAERRIEALPWVAKARVRKSWPGTIRIDVTERRAVAQVPAGSQWLSVDRSGRVLEMRDERRNDLLALPWDGPPGQPGATLSLSRDLLALAAALPPAFETKVEGVQGSGSSIALELAGGATVRLGDGAALRQKLIAALTIIGTPAGACASVINVEVPSAPTLTARKGCA